MIKLLVIRGRGLLSASQELLRQNPGRVVGLLAALALGSAGGAFAVASLLPDPTDVKVREVLEAVSPLPPVAPDLVPLTLYRSELTRSSDTAQTLLKRLGVDDTQASIFLHADANTRQSLLGRAGRYVSVEVQDGNQLHTLTARWASDGDSSFQRLVVTKTANGFQSRLETAPLHNSTRLASGTIQSSLFAATDDANIPDAVSAQLAEIFSGDIDFHRALRRGDRFSVVYESLEADGEPLRSGRVLSAEFVNRGKSFQAMWFQNPADAPQVDQGAYYTLDGQSLKRTYLASPLAFSRISSGFSMRFHPILKIWKAHLGVDYAAAAGTPVRSVGDGVVDFAGVQNGFGNVVVVKHPGQDSTVYAHLSRIHVRKGETISQGHNIGAVGATGWATGPHLHFEFRVNGAHQDPLSLAHTNESMPIAASAKAEFASQAAVSRLALAAAASLQHSSAQ